ncbi:AzlC family ABC transporter permease [Paucidesulfovibrio longus]|uniref:AzlC family ABC transporter permease n=1 Tax=Paucidesulfovibrio longus TaxID=889 RepID=UPI000482A179|nr:AzlC family ABC transporter permease [Paucidesulfovibrio longus]
MSRRNEYMEGARALLPIVPGVLPFAAICGMAAVEAGMSVREAFGFAFLVNAGASQLAALHLMGRGAGFALVVLAVLVVNLRFTMYSASVAPYLQNAPTWARWIGGFILSDQAFGVSVIRMEQGASHRFYIGAALTMFASWHFGNAMGVLLGSFVPASWELEFAVPLCFLALIFPALRDRPCAVAAVVGGVVAVFAASLPYNLGLMAGAFAGIGAGLLAEVRKKAEA